MGKAATPSKSPTPMPPSFKSYTTLPLSLPTSSFLYYKPHTTDASTTLFVANIPSMGMYGYASGEETLRAIFAKLLLDLDLSLTVTSVTVLTELSLTKTNPASIPFVTLKQQVHECQANTTASLRSLIAAAGYEGSPPQAQGQYGKVSFSGNVKPLLNLASAVKQKQKKGSLSSPYSLTIDAEQSVKGSKNVLKHLASTYLATRPPPPSTLKNLADTVLSAYADLESSWKAGQETVVDADGWETVTYKSTKSDITRAVEASRGGRDKPGSKRARGNKASKKDGLTDFYRFQIRDAKKQKVVDLKEGFERDRERVARIKQEGGFNAFGK